MTNATLQLLTDLAWEHRRAWAKEDPEQRMLWEEYQTLLKDFMEEHRGNRRLRGTVLRLLDLHDALEDSAQERWKEVQFQFGSVAQSCPTLCDPMNRSTPGLPVHHQLPEFTQTPSSQ